MTLQTNTLDASVFGDAIEAFLKGLSGSNSSSSPVKSVEKRVSFRWTVRLFKSSFHKPISTLIAALPKSLSTQIQLNVNLWYTEWPPFSYRRNIQSVVSTFPCYNLYRTREHIMCYKKIHIEKHIDVTDHTFLNESSIFRVYRMIEQVSNL